MKQGDIYQGKPEGLAQWRDYPTKIRLISQVQDPIYANQGSWFVEVWSNKYQFEWSIIQNWTEDQIRHIFKV